MKQVTKESSINDIIQYLGIEIIGTRETGVYWKYNNKSIPRPPFKACWKAVKENFNIDSDLLKFDDGYYK
jgi:hypothetical protein